MFGTHQSSISMQMLKCSFLVLFYFYFLHYFGLGSIFEITIYAPIIWICAFYKFLNYLIEAFTGAFHVTTEKAIYPLFSGQCSWQPPNTESVSTKKQTILGHFPDLEQIWCLFKTNNPPPLSNINVNKCSKVFKQMLQGSAKESLHLWKRFCLHLVGAFLVDVPLQQKTSVLNLSIRC